MKIEERINKLFFYEAKNYVNKPMTCEKCRKKVNIIRIGKNHEKLCDKCYNEKYRTTKKVY